MNNRNVIIYLIFLFILLNATVKSQIIHESGYPLGINKSLDEYTIIYNFPGSVIDSMRKAFLEVPGENTFAVFEKTDLNSSNSGQLSDLPGEDKVWILKVRSENAKSLNIIFSAFQLLEGERVYVYDSGMNNIIGPLTSKNNNAGKSLAVAPVPGDELIIEYYIKYPGPENRLKVGKVCHDFIGIADLSGAKDAFYGDSQPCNIDISCNEGVNWQKEKNAVVRIIADGIELGTGFLLNNTNQENIPYVLTAYHVIETLNSAQNSVFFFRYESSYCEGPDGLAQYTLSGSRLMASDEEMDFTLVKLYDFPPITYKPYFAAWDVSGDIPDSTVAIHHPSGDVKKISIDSDPPIVDTFLNFYTNGFWKVLEWDLGTTEGGSSGSPLFDQNKRAVGLLSGGEAVCGRSVNDYFARIDIAYDLYSEFNKSLLPWLDPARSGVETLDGRDPYADNKIGFDTLCNCTGERIITEYELPATGYTTGYNSDSLVMYAELFSTDPGKEFTELIFEVAESNITENLDSITVYIMDGITEPGSVLARRTVFVRDAQDSTELYIDYLEPFPLPADFFVAWHLWFREQASAEQQQFAIFHSNPVAQSANTAYFKDELVWRPFSEHPYLPEPVNLCLKVITSDNTVYNDVQDLVLTADEFKVYPNPVSDYINIKSDKAINGEVLFSVFNMEGRSMLSGSFTSYGKGAVKSIDFSELKSGIYYLNLKYSNKQISFKLIIE